MLTTPGFCDEAIHLYLAEQLSAVTASPERHELIEIHWIPFEQALEQVYAGIIHDAKTMLGLMLAESRIHR